MAWARAGFSLARAGFSFSGKMVWSTVNTVVRTVTPRYVRARRDDSYVPVNMMSLPLFLIVITRPITRLIIGVVHLQSTTEHRTKIQYVQHQQQQYTHVRKYISYIYICSPNFKQVNYLPVPK